MIGSDEGFDKRNMRYGVFPLLSEAFKGFSENFKGNELEARQEFNR